MNTTSNCKSACLKTASTSNHFCRERPHYKCVQQVLKFGFTSEERSNLSNIAMGEQDVTLCGIIVYFSFHGFNRKGNVANNSFVLFDNIVYSYELRIPIEYACPSCGFSKFLRRCNNFKPKVNATQLQLSGINIRVVWDLQTLRTCDHLFVKQK